MHNNVGLCFCCLTCNGYVCKDWQRCEFSHIVMTFNLVAHEVDDEDYASRYGKTQDQGNEHYHWALGAYLAHILRIINQLTLIGCGSKRYRVFLTFLKQHEIQSRLNVLLTSNLCEDALLLRCGVCLACVSAIHVGNVVALNLHALACLYHCALNAWCQVVKLCCKRRYRGAAFACATEQSVTRNHDVVIFVDERCCWSIRQTNVWRQGLVFVWRVIQILGNAVLQRHLGVGFSQLLAVDILVLYCLSCVHLQLNHVVAFFIFLKRALCASQFSVDFFQTTVDEFFCSYRNLVLVFVGLTVIADGQLAQVVDSSLWTLVFQYQFCDGCGLWCLAYRQRTCIFGCNAFGWQYRYL